MIIMELLVSAFVAFWNTPAGVAVWAIADVCVLVLLLALNYRWLGKRLLDILFSVAFLAAFLPFFALFLLVSFFIYRKEEGFTLFEGMDVYGKKGKVFRLVLLRCERTAYDEGGLPLPVSARTTPLGRVCRACGMRWYTALPAVFLGKMSFVGPRPMLPADAAALTGEQRARFAVRPGLVSSLARYGGKKLTFDDMFEEDAEYAAHISLLRDALFFCSAFAAHCRGEGDNLGVCGQWRYLDYLLREGKISAAGYAAYAEEEKERLRRKAQEAIDRENFRRR